MTLQPWAAGTLGTCTEFGRSLRPVLVALAAWRSAQLAPEDSAMILVDSTTGWEVEPAVIDPETGISVTDPRFRSPPDPLRGPRATKFQFLVRDGAGQFATSFDAALSDAVIEAVKIPPRCPSTNCFAERFVLTARTELTNRMLIFRERHLRTVLAEYGAHYNGRRPHRAVQLLPPRSDHPTADLGYERIRRRRSLEA